MLSYALRIASIAIWRTTDYHLLARSRATLTRRNSLRDATLSVPPIRLRHAFVTHNGGERGIFKYSTFTPELLWHHGEFKNFGSSLKMAKQSARREEQLGMYSLDSPRIKFKGLLVDTCPPVSEFTTDGQLSGYVVCYERSEATE